MSTYLRYLWYVIRHKFFVGVECFKAGLYWRGISHDWHKLLPSEFFPYARHFYGKGKKGIKEGRDKSGAYRAGMSGKDEFDFAWLLHQKRARHHWQWWHLVCDEDGERTFPMGEVDVVEMICDWKGAGRAISGQSDPIGWYKKNGRKMKLHPMTREYIELALEVKQ